MASGRYFVKRRNVPSNNSDIKAPFLNRIGGPTTVDMSIHLYEGCARIFSFREREDYALFSGYFERNIAAGF